MGRLKASCGTCNAWLKQPGGKQGLCRANPPLPIMLGMKQQKAIVGLPNSGVAEPMIASVFPQMTDTGWCRAWEPSTDMEAELFQVAQGGKSGEQTQEQEQAEAAPAA